MNNDKRLFFAEKTANGKASERFPICSIYYILKGEAEAKIGKKTFSLFKGDALFLPPCKACELSSATGFSYAVVAFENGDFVLPKKPTVFFDDAENNLRSAILLGVRLFNACPSGENQAVVGALSALVSLLICGTKKRSELTDEIIRIARQEYRSLSFDMEEYLKSLPYSYDYLRRAFKAETGSTPLVFLTALRLEYAAARLRCGKTEIKTLSKEVGISDPLYFSRMFKKRFFLSPSDYADKYKLE